MIGKTLLIRAHEAIPPGCAIGSTYCTYLLQWWACAELKTAQTRLELESQDEDEEEDGFEAQSLRDASMIGIARRPLPAPDSSAG